ncbi:MAG: histidinol dehydrogenase [Gammaproteobacteria bacterium]|nr:histidinol dehydrogenase [Gammaproteobacteria bacterium]
MLINITIWSELSSGEKDALLQRPANLDNRNISARTAQIVDTVRQRGDAALFDFSRQFEGRELDALKVSRREFAAAESALSRAAKEAIDTAISNVRRFHESQLPTETDIQVIPGVRCQRLRQAIDSVGLYVPAGTAPLPSAAIMLTVPAAIAGCPERVMCTPANQDNKVNAATLVAAQRSGVTDVFKIGGAQAIAAMAYGTATVPEVARIFGPGNAWVTAAKSIVASDPAGASIDMPAGPSEVLIIADDTANPVFIAADLLSQAEHGEDSQVVLITDSREVAEKTILQIDQQIAALARRNIARSALCHGRVILTKDIPTAVAINNDYAPEHLILQTRRPRDVLAQVRNAGSVFLGRWTPESVGDYCSGTNHVLPTYGNAKSYSGLGVEQFMRWMSVQELTREGLRSLAPTTIELAGLEGLDAHAQAVRLRFNDSGERGAT